MIGCSCASIPVDYEAVRTEMGRDRMLSPRTPSSLESLPKGITDSLPVVFEDKIIYAEEKG